MLPGDLFDGAARLARAANEELLRLTDPAARADALGRWWGEAVALGWPGLYLPEECGGAGGSVEDLAALVEGAASDALPLPVAAVCGVLPALLTAVPAARVRALADERLCPVLAAYENWAPAFPPAAGDARGRGDPAVRHGARRRDPGRRQGLRGCGPPGSRAGPVAGSGVCPASATPALRADGRPVERRPLVRRRHRIGGRVARPRTGRRAPGCGSVGTRRLPHLRGSRGRARVGDRARDQLPGRAQAVRRGAVQPPGAAPQGRRGLHHLRDHPRPGAARASLGGRAGRRRGRWRLPSSISAAPRARRRKRSSSCTAAWA